MHDYRYCSTCGHGASGYGFVATVQGVDPCICPDCKNRTLRPVTLPGLVLRAARDKIFKRRT